jgi:hypothetical protein
LYVRVSVAVGPRKLVQLIVVSRPGVLCGIAYDGAR